MDRGGARRLGGCITGVICTYISDLSRSRLRVNRVILTVRRQLPIYPDKQTISEPVGNSILCHKRTQADRALRTTTVSAFSGWTSERAKSLKCLGRQLQGKLARRELATEWGSLSRV
jgi:hypothetical protein